MNILVISTDYYFYSGVLDFLRDNDIRCDHICLNDLNPENITMHATGYSVVIIDVSSTRSISNLFSLNNPFVNILFVIDIRPELLEGNLCTISKKEAANTLLDRIRSIVYFKIPRIRDVEFSVLRLYNSGRNMTAISSQLNITEKALYRLRYSLVIKLGFLRYHPLTTIYSEIIASFFMGRYHRRTLSIS